MGLRNTDSTLYRQLSAPPPSTPMPPPPPENNGSDPEDQGRDIDRFIDSSLSIDQVVAWIGGETPRAKLDSSLDDGDDD